MRVHRSFHVEQSVETVIRYLADFGHAEQWDPGTRSCIRLDSGPVARGATWRNVSHILGSDTILTYTLERLEPDRITLVGRNESATSTDEITVRADGSGAEVTYEATIDLHGAARLGTPIMKIEMERLGTKTVAGIQASLAAL